MEQQHDDFEELKLHYNTQNDQISKLSTRHILEFEYLKFAGDVKEWPAFITTYNRTTKDCDFSTSENMERLRKCLAGSARECVKMILLTNDAERVVKN
jgi:hypothetical protein